MGEAREAGFWRSYTLARIEAVVNAREGRRLDAGKVLARLPRSNRRRRRWGLAAGPVGAGLGARGGSGRRWLAARAKGEAEERETMKMAEAQQIWTETGLGGRCRT